MNPAQKQILDDQIDAHADAFYTDRPCCRAAYELGRVDALINESERNGKAIRETVRKFDAPITHTQEEYEQRPFPVQCATCGTIAYAPEKQLREDGWRLSRRGEFCELH